MFKKFFSSSIPEEKKALPWISLSKVKQLDDILEKSKAKTQLIFKHSTRCGISSMVKSQFESNYDEHINADLYYLDLLSYREVSSEVALRFQVMHQSPQLLIIRNGVVVAHDSHGAINDLNLTSFI